MSIDVKSSKRVTDILSYAHDASHYTLKPESVYTPENPEELAQILKFATELGKAVTFRSGGTSLSGQALTEAIMVDTRKHFRKIEIGKDGLSANVSPGATVRAVNNLLSTHKMKLGPDPASEIACTIGGVVANNSSGMCCGTEQNSYQTIESLLLVLPSGLVVDTGAPDADAVLALTAPEIHAGLLQIREHIRSNEDSVATIKRLFSIKNTMGYGVNSFLDFDSPIKILEHLIIGSEGTLAFVAQARFTTVPAYSHMATGLLIFASLADATRVLPDLVKAGFAAIELMDATSLKVAQRDPQATQELKSIAVEKHAALLVEFQEASRELLEAKISSTQPLLDSLALIQPAELTNDLALRNQLWHIRKGLYATVAGNRPLGTTALLEDIAVPVAQLLSTCEELIQLFADHGYADSVIFGHARDGNIHFMLNEEFEKPEKLARYKAFTEDMVELVLRHGGTLKAEHGTGRMMAPFVKRQYGAELYEVMWAIKRLLDPAGILNPGVILTENPNSHIENLKVFPTIEMVANSCVECGYCEPVCPSKNLTLTPRNRIVMRRELVLAKARGDRATSKAIENEFEYEGKDTCAVDGMCATTCPLSINTGSLVRELRSESAQPVISALWSLAAHNWSAFTRTASVALSIAHITPGFRKYPTGGKRRKFNAVENADAIFFPSCVGTLFGTSDSSQALLTLADRAGIRLYIPKGVDALCCGTPWKSKGYVEGYEIMQQKTMSSLVQASRDGKLPIITDAASCSHGLQELLATDPNLKVIDSVEFVEKFVLSKLSIKKTGSIAVHPTCSTTALGVSGSLNAIAQAISTETFVPENWGCCAFAGDRGLTFPELTKSATDKQAAEIRVRNDDFYVSANRSCEIGMSQATGKNYRHIIEVLEELSR